ncbi:hypothetical protein MJD09_09500 [bacterium]|nr:hypothetical protein [bacterium]
MLSIPSCATGDKTSRHPRFLCIVPSPRLQIYHYGTVETGEGTLKLNFISGKTKMIGCEDPSKNFDLRGFTNAEVDEARVFWLRRSPTQLKETRSRRRSKDPWAKCRSSTSDNQTIVDDAEKTVRAATGRTIKTHPARVSIIFKPSGPMYFLGSKSNLGCVLE